MVYISWIRFRMMISIFLMLVIMAIQSSPQSCFGVDSGSDDVCSSHGECSSTDVCVCFDYANYGGLACNITRCSGVDLNNGTYLCNGHGDCNPNIIYEGKHVCDCEDGFGGFQCVDTKCYGIYQDNTTHVCSGNGVCTNTGICECTNAIGAACEIGKCGEYYANDSLACNQHGKCDSKTKKCVCNYGFKGDVCEEFGCYGLFPGDDGTCHNHGTCYGYDNCVCDSDYFGDECEQWQCYGKNSTSVDVCTGHGNCVDENICECYTDDYYSSECEYFDCFGVGNILDFLTCSEHGKCIDQDVCLCDDGYTGTECKDFSCAGVHWNTTGVCAGHGRCSQPDNCQCQGNYFGEVEGAPCSFLSCFGSWNVEFSVCSGHGECIELDTCKCDDGYDGIKCEYPKCGEYLAIKDNEDLICSSHGTCVGPDKCVCEGNFGNWDCGACLPDYTGDDCDILWCDRDVTCNAHGGCNGLDCECFENFKGQFCDSCIENKHGMNCSVYCNENSNCSGHGVCSSTMCRCYDDAEHGYWTNSSSDVDCGICVSGWFGSRCNLKIDTEFLFSDENDRITTSITFYPHSIQTIPNTIIHSDDREKFGKSPLLSFIEDHKKLEIVFGEGATLLPGQTFKLNLLHIEKFVYPDELQDPEEWFDCTSLAAQNPVLPTATLAGPVTISACDDLTLNGMASSSTDGRGVTFSFHLVKIEDSKGKFVVQNRLNCTTKEDYNFTDPICPENSDIQSIFDAKEDPKYSTIKIPSINMTVGYRYFFSLTVTSAFSLVSEPSQLVVFVSAETIPVIYIPGGSSKRVVSFKSTVYTIEGTGLICGKPIPSSSDGLFEYKWRKTKGADVTPLLLNNGKRAVFTKNSEGAWFAYPGNYYYEFTIYLASDWNVNSTLKVPIEVVASDLVAVLEGGNKTVSSPYYAPIDARGSYDPDETDYEEGPYYIWTCKNLALNSYCTDDFLGILDSEGNPTISNFKHYLYTGEYLISLKFKKGNRVAYSSVHFVVVEEFRDVLLSVSSIPPAINPNEALVMEGLVLYRDPESELGDLDPTRDYFDEKSQGRIYVNWTLNGEPFKDEQRFTVPGELILGVYPDVFQIGNVYEIGFVATVSYADFTYEVITQVNVNAPPSPGTFTVRPAGIGPLGFVEDFEFVALYWKDEHLPLTYTYFYQNGDSYFVLVPESTKFEVTTRIPVLKGNLTLSVEVKDALGASTFSSYELTVEEVALEKNSTNTTELVNVTVTYFMEKAEDSQTYEECASQMNSANEFLKELTYLSLLSAFQSQDYRDQVSEGWARCSTIDPFYQASPSSASLSINSANTLLSVLGTENDDGSVTISGAVMSSLIDNIATMGDLGGDAMTPSNVGGMANVCGALFSNLNGGEVDSTPGSGAAMMNKVLSLVSKVSATLATSMVIGQPPTVISNDVFTISASVVRDTAEEITYGEIKIGLLDAIKNFEFAGGRRGVGTKNSLEVTSVAYTEPPFSDKANLTGPSTNLVFGKGGQVIPAQNYSKPLPITLVSNISNAPLEQNPRETGNRPFCAWLDTGNNVWVTEGCELVEFSDGLAQCECDKAQNNMFGTLYAVAAPDLNLLSAQDFANVSKLNVDNMTALIFVCSVAFVYLFLVLMFEILSVVGPMLRRYLTRRYLDSKGKSSTKAGLESDMVRGYIIDYVRDNLWLSIMFLPPDEKFFPRAQRLTVLYLVFLGVFLCNALTYGKDEGNFIQGFFSSIVSSILVFPIGLIAGAFTRIDARQNLLSSQREIREAMDEEMKERFSVELGLDWEGQDDGGNLEEDEEIDMGVMERMTRGCSVVMFSVQQMVISFQDWMENSSTMITVSMVVILCFVMVYFIGVLFCDLGAVFYMTWLGELGAVIISAAAITVFLCFFLFLFWYNKKKRFIETVNEGHFIEWSTSAFKIINLVVFSIFSIILFLMLFTCITMHFVGIINTKFLIPIEVCILVLVFSSIAWLYTVFVEPSRKKKKSKKKKKKKKKEEKNTKFPHFFSYPVYFAAYLMAMGMSFLIVVYGIKFDSDPNLKDQDSKIPTSGRWLMGGGGSVISDFSLMEPVKHVFKTIAIYCIIQLFSRVFLSF